jgi:hypothetical protein
MTRRHLGNLPLVDMCGIRLRSMPPADLLKRLIPVLHDFGDQFHQFFPSLFQGPAPD